MMMIIMMERGSCKNPDIEVYIGDWIWNCCHMKIKGMMFWKVEFIRWYDGAKERTCVAGRIKLIKLSPI